MKLFHRNKRYDSEAHRHVYARFEIAYTTVDFLAAVLFIVGSIMFFYDAWQETGTWLFLFGSVFFAAKPTLRLLREVKLYRLGDIDDLARRANGRD